MDITAFKLAYPALYKLLYENIEVKADISVSEDKSFLDFDLHISVAIPEFLQDLFS